MKNLDPFKEKLKEKLLAKYLSKDKVQVKEVKNPDINIMLNRVKTNQRNEARKKLYFSAAASTGLILFGILIF